MPLVGVVLLAAAGMLGHGGCGVIVGTSYAIADAAKSDSDGTASATVSSVSPASGSHGGGYDVTIRGTGFGAGGLVVTIGGVQADVQNFSGGQISATVPVLPAAGPADVRVSSSGVSAGVLPGGFDATNAVPVAVLDPIPDGQTGSVAVKVTLTDADSATVNELTDLVVEYSLDGGAFQPVTDAMLTGGLSSIQAIQAPATASAGGHVFAVDTRVFAPSDNATLQFQITPIDTFDTGGLSQAQRSGATVLSNAFTLVNNNPPSLSLVSAPDEDDNDVTVVFQVDDADPSNVLTLLSATWTDLQSGASGAATPSADSPVLVGVPGLARQTNLVFQWDSRADLGFGNDALVQLELEVSDGSNSSLQTFTPFFVNNGPLDRTETIATGTPTEDVEATDLDGDGLTDMVLSSETQAELQVYTGQVTGDFLRGVALLVDPNTVCGPISAYDLETGAGLRRTVACLDLQDSSNGIVSVFYNSGTGDFEADAAPLITGANLALPFADSRAKTFEVGDFSDPPDGLADVVVLLRDGNTPRAGGAQEPGGGYGQLAVFEQDGAGGYTVGEAVLPVDLWFGWEPGLPVAEQPGDFHLGDANGDGRPDLVVAAPGEGKVHVYFQVADDDGLIELVEAAALTVDIPGQYVVSADFGDVNGDGWSDAIAVANDGVSAATVLVFLSDGAGGFSATPDTTIAVPRRLEEIRAANLTEAIDGDAYDDLVVGDPVSSNIGVFIADPAQPSGFLEAGGVPINHAFPTGLGGVRHLALGDVDGDGNDDVLAASPSAAVPVFRVAPPRLFRAPVPVGIQNIAVTLASADILPDAVAAASPKQEVCAVDGVTRDLIVLVEDPVLTLSPQRFSPFRAQQAVAAGDEDGDGMHDTILHLVPSADGVYILGVAIIPYDSSDLRSTRPSLDDSFLDPYVLVDDYASSGGVLPSGVGSITPPYPDALTSASQSTSDPTNTEATTVITLADGVRFVFFERPIGAVGYESVVTSQLALAYGDVGRGVYDDDGAPTTPAVPLLTSAGSLDIVVSPLRKTPFHALAGVFVLYGDTTYGFSKAQRILGPNNQPGFASNGTDAGDPSPGTFDNSAGGFIDFLLVDLINPLGTVPPQLSIVAGVREDDELPDVTGAKKNTLVILDQDAGGDGLEAFYDFDPGSGATGLPFQGMLLAAGDFDGDTYRDLALSSNLGPTCNVLFNTGTPRAGTNAPASATFSVASELRSRPRGWELANGDFDLDGAADDLAMTTFSGAVMVYTGNGDGTFEIQRLLEIGGEPTYVIRTDLNGDGRDDLVVGDQGSGSVTVFVHK